ncbi:MAG: alpha/beta hydrolase [Candidatus Lokiarchaeota archaeon]|nr:alpha/beta hydrolase [Candidatus Lokiarchaeota archaeon]
MHDRDASIARQVILSILLVLFIACIGFMAWPLTGLYGSRLDWWGGNSAIRATSYAVFMTPAGAIGAVVVAHFLFTRKGVVRGFQIAAVAAGAVLTSACLPYFAIPVQVGQAARQEFSTSWGTGWENLVRAPAGSPWLADPYNLGIYYTGLPINKDGFTKIVDVPFLTVDNDTFKFDAYVPAGTGPFPAIIFIHGGGWCGLDKDSMMTYQGEYFADAGYVVFSIQYGAIGERNRTRQHGMQEIMDNIASFSDWIATPANTAAYKVDLGRCFVNGLSAGGHLSALVSIARYNVSAWNPAVNLLGGVDFYGITDIRHWNKISQSWLHDTGLFNDSVLSDFTVVDRYSPISYLQTPGSDLSEAIPMLILHGDADSVVDVNQSRAFDASSDARGLKCVYIEIPRAEHVFEANSREAGAQISLWAMERFFQLCMA